MERGGNKFGYFFRRKFAEPKFSPHSSSQGLLAINWDYIAKFNKKVSKGADRVYNHMGSKSFKQTPPMELIFACLTTFLEDSYYEKKDERVERIVGLIRGISDHEFIAKLAIVARNEFHMRSVSHLLVGELSRIHKGDSLVKDTIVAVANRPDDLMEIVSYVMSTEGNVPKQVKRGVRNALLKFDRYSLDKYKGEGRKVSLVDLFNLTHPKVQHATSEQKKAWTDLIEGKLPSFDTWETEISNAKNDKERTEIWENLVKEDKLGYMALLRNLNNLMKYGVSEKTIKLAAKKLADPAEVAKSKQLPFRFLSAYEAISGGRKPSTLRFEDEKDNVGIFTNAIAKALEASLQNLPELPGRTMILTDNSGSMQGDRGGGSAVSAMSSTKTADIANLFAVMFWKKANSTIVGVFGDTLEIPKLDREADIFDNYKVIAGVGSKIGGSTEKGIFEMFRQIIRERKMVDRIVIFSDCQVGEGCKWYDHEGNGGDDFNELWKKYKAINPKCIVYSVDLKGYGNSMFKDDVVKMSGWSDKIFKLMEVLEKGNSLIDYINSKTIVSQKVNPSRLPKAKKAKVAKASKKRRKQ